MKRLRFLRPRIEWMRWGGDGMHGSSERGFTFTDGRCLAIAWLGLHIEIALAIETGGLQ